jgi:hypothetical protein
MARVRICPKWFYCRAISESVFCQHSNPHLEDGECRYTVCRRINESVACIPFVRHKGGINCGRREDNRGHK